MLSNHLWETYQQELGRFVHRRIDNRMDAEDVLQDVLLKAYAKQHHVASEENAMGWLFQIARHAIIDYYRGQHSVVVPLSDDVPSSPVEDNREEEALIACMVSLVEKLPEKYRTALVAAEFQQVPQHLLSKQLGLSYSGTKSRVQRGRDQLRQLIEAICVVEVSHYKGHACTPQLSFCDCDTRACCA
jgi:RNA polymerase sigma-70 factor (ECF subfamily)